MPTELTFDASIPVVSYLQKSKVEASNNLFNEYGPEEGQSDEEEDLTYNPYLKQELHLHVVYDTTVYKDRGSLIPMTANYYHFDEQLGMYDPIVYLSDFWVLNRDLVHVDQENIDRIKLVKAGEK